MQHPDFDGFPTLPPYSGCWWPVYYTPLAGSGERLTAFVVARGDDADVCIRPTIRPDVLRAAFGASAAAGTLRFFDVIQASLATWALTPDATWHPPLSSFSMGACRIGYANNIRQLAAQGVTLEAAFADVAYADLNQP